MNGSWIEVDLGRLDGNIRRVRAALPPATSLMFVVKANAYGHGAAEIARQAAASGVTWFAVAYEHEALAVRAVAPAARILVLGAADPEAAGVMAEAEITPVIVSEEHGLALSRAARAAGKKLRVHLKIDTGMGRFGVPWDVAAQVYERLSRSIALDFEGLCTHFASVEIERPSLGPTQMERFAEVCGHIDHLAGRRHFRHASSTRAFLYHDTWDLDGVRPGIVLYGYGAGEAGMRIRTEPILQWKTRVLQVKRVPAGATVGYYSLFVAKAPTVIATIAAGYADGYHRSLSDKGVVLVGGQRYTVAGRVSMNWITVDCGPEARIKAGDEAVLIGAQGGESIWAAELAKSINTIPYELLTSINAHLPRTYIPCGEQSPLLSDASRSAKLPQ